MVYRTSLLFYSLLYPSTFTLKLNPGYRCFYVSNNIIEGQWNSPDIKGTVYSYTFDGFDGRNKNTCKFGSMKSFIKDTMYYTGDSSYPMAELGNSKY